VNRVTQISALLILALAIWLALPSFSPGPESRPQEKSPQVPSAPGSGESSGTASGASPATPPTLPAASSTTSEVRFGGEVLRGQWFEHDIGHDLVFRLNPSEADESGGWVIEILPKTQPPDGPAEFSAVATPPYHFYNDRYIEAVYGYSPREALQITARKFYFVVSLADQQIASDVVNAALYPSTSSEQEKARVAAEASGLSLGRGQLRILHSRLIVGKGGSSDAIASIRFEVSLEFSPGLTLQQVLAPAPPTAR
jgi:hypothetical protein